MTEGFVKIVGAGIGSEDLITIKGKEALENADVIIYDQLLNYNLIKPYEGKKELYFAGKIAGKHFLKQEETNALLVKKAKEGKKVVRLKGGDPYIFGRGGEEADVLYENNIPFEIIPGVTAGVVSLMYAGIPATYRNISTSISFITGQRKKGVIGNFKNYAKLDGTLVFYMGLNNIEKITSDLLEGGIEPEKPACIISNGAYPHQKIFISTVGKIAEEIKNVELKSPNLIVIGDVINFRENLNFYEKKELFGKKIAITRATSQSSTLKKKLGNLGCETFEIPCIKIEENIEDDFLEMLKNFENYNFTHLVFHSTNSVEIFFKYFLKYHDLRDLGKIKIATVGKMTTKVLNKYHLNSDLCPENFYGKNLVELIKNDDVKNKKILLPHSKKTDEKLLNSYSEIGELFEYKIYDSVLPEKIENFPKNLDYIMFTSSSTVDNFMKMYSLELEKNTKLVAIGKMTENSIKNYSFHNYFVSKDATIDSMIDFIKEDSKKCE